MMNGNRVDLETVRKSREYMAMVLHDHCPFCTRGDIVILGDGTSCKCRTCQTIIPAEAA